MEIFETLRKDHALVRDQLDLLIGLTADRSEVGASKDEWIEAFYDLKMALVAHNRAEESVFYDVMNRVPNRPELSDIKTEEHHLAEETLQDLEEMSPSDRDWSAMLALLKNQIESHVAEEETFVFGVMQDHITSSESERMSEDFLRLRNAEFLGRGYRPKLVRRPTSRALPR